MEENKVFISRTEALVALQNGRRVQFHWKDKVVEIALDTTLDDLRWLLMARLKLLVRDVTGDNYSIIE